MVPHTVHSKTSYLCGQATIDFIHGIQDYFTYTIASKITLRNMSKMVRYQTNLIKTHRSVNQGHFYDVLYGLTKFRLWYITYIESV